ncbi:hypothetical protein CL619_03085 [archaeon]|nr:hypothetical protein [archaeon]|tara:strand:- start:6137 stop:6514 length:378 start_codon:yes stop_codon:yes gene_type:complete
METDIEKLQARYSTAHCYDSLSTEQVAFLLDSRNMNKSDAGGGKTVWINGVHSDPEVGTLVDIVDVFSFAFLRNSPGKAAYRSKRLAIARHHFGEEHLLEDGTYLFELADGNKVRIEYDCVKDRV